MIHKVLSMVAPVALAIGLLMPTAQGQGGGSGCEGDMKLEGSGTIVAPVGFTIAGICIKAGRGIFTFGAGAASTLELGTSS